MGWRNTSFLTFVLILACTILPACGDELQLPRLGKTATILAFGDSLTKGYSVRPEDSYPAILQGMVNRTVINAGVSGEESRDGLKRLPALLEKHAPDLLILCHGGNDILRKKNMQNMAANVTAMIRLATERQIPVVLLAVPEPGLFLSPAPIYREIAEATKVPMINDLIPGILGKASLKADTVHPNAQGNQVMAREIFRFLQKSGAI